MDDSCEYILNSAANAVRNMQRALQPDTIASGGEQTNSLNLFTTVVIGLTITLLLMHYLSNQMRNSLRQDKLQRDQFRDDEPLN